MNNEDTIFDNENNKFDKGETQLDNNVKQKTEKNKTNSKKTTNNSRVVDNNGIEEDNTVEDNKKRSFLKKAAAGLGMGVLMGAAAAYASDDDVDLAGADLESMVGEELIEESIEEPTEGLSLSDGEISVASSVSNEMSFSEAFAAAREEVGPGGVFEWNGNVYNTYYAEEWENMSDEEREEFASHLNVEEPSDSDEELLVEAEDEEVEVESEEPLDSDEELLVEAEDEEVEVENEEPLDSDEELLVEAEDEEIEIIDEETTDSEEELLAEAEDEEISVDEDVDIVEQEEAGVEVLGIYEDAETGANIGVIDVDGQEGMLIDVDGDNNFDYIAADIDGDGVISEYEIGDISEENMTVDMLEAYDEAYDDGYDDGYDDESMAFDDFDDNVDYINDADVSDYMA